MTPSPVFEGMVVHHGFSGVSQLCNTVVQLLLISITLAFHNLDQLSCTDLYCRRSQACRLMC
jgi:hypothetical protein